MKSSFTEKESIEILKRALTAKDQKLDKQPNGLTYSDLEKVAEELGISKEDLLKATKEVSQIKEHKRDEAFPEVVATRWISGHLSEKDIENVFSELKSEFGGSYQWNGNPVKVHKIGDTWEFPLKDATVKVMDKGDRYQLLVTAQQFFHGNNLEAALLGIPVAFLLGLLPVTAAAEWASTTLAVLMAMIFYIISIPLVKQFTAKQRASNTDKLQQITTFAETQLQKAAETKVPTILDDITDDQTEEANKREDLRQRIKN